MINVGVIGYGYWGPNIVRNFYNHPQLNLKSVSDIDSSRLALVTEAYPNIQTTTDYKDIIKDKSIDLVAIITSISSHFDIAKSALLNGKHVFVEKPFTSTSDQAKELIDLAKASELTIMVDHTFLFTGAAKNEGVN